jgi:hypothetical protein
MEKTRKKSVRSVVGFRGDFCPLSAYAQRYGKGSRGRRLVHMRAALSQIAAISSPRAIGFWHHTVVRVAPNPLQTNKFALA